MHHVFKCHPFIMTLALKTVIIIGAVVLSLANFCSRSHYSRNTFILKLWRRRLVSAPLCFSGWLSIFLMDCFCLKHNTLINVNHKSGSVCNALQIASMKSSLHIVTNSWACFRKWPEGKRWSWDAFQLIKAAKSFLASIKQQFGILTSPYWISPTAVQTFFFLCHRQLCS